MRATIGINEPVTGHVPQYDGMLHLVPGEVVMVRDAGEIEATLDADGKLEGLPFMDEMRPFCGRKFRVFRRPENCCVDSKGMRRLRNIVMLSGVFCDGSVHGGCDRTCRLLWNEAWLRRSADSDGLETPGLPLPSETLSGSRVSAVTGESLQCQSTELHLASEPLAWDHFLQYLLDILDYPPEKMLKLGWIMIGNRFRNRLGLPDEGRLLGSKRITPDVSLNLRPGEYVRMKSAEEITDTLSRIGKNRGLEFMPEMTQLCGKTFRVLKRVERLIHEKNGRVYELKNTVLLDKGTCDGMYHQGCPRDCFFLVREVWLERLNR